MLRWTVNARTIIEEMANLELRQVPYAMERGMNMLATEAQAAQRQGLRDRFDLRRVDWNLRGIKIEKANFATKTSWRVIIQVDPRVSYLDRFEEEGVHVPFGGRRYLWVPNDRVFHNKIIQAGNPLHPKNLHLGSVQGPKRKGGGSDYGVHGLQNTFMIRTPKGPMVIQRLGRGQGTSFTGSSLAKLTLDSFGKKQGGGLVQDKKAGTQVLYVLRERVSVPLKLEFFPTVTQVVQERAAPVFRQAITRAIAGSRV